MAQASVILVNPVVSFYRHWNNREQARRVVQRRYPPINLLRLAGALKEAGYRVHILDCNIEPRPEVFLSRVCETENVVAVGFTVKMAPLILTAQILSYYVKLNYPKVATVWGGLLPTILPETVLTESYCDYAVVGKGEECLISLCDALVAGRDPGDIPGLAYLNDRRALVRNPEQEQARRYLMDLSFISDKLNERQTPYLAATVATEGCPLRCSFCYLSALDETLADHARWVERPCDEVLTEIDAFRAHGMNVFTFLDDNFFLNRHRVLPLLQAFKEREIYVEEAITSIQTINEEVVAAAAPILQQIGYSIETVNEDLQKVLNKRIPRHRMIRANKLLADYDINSVHNFIVGIPGETDDHLRENIELAVELRDINPYVRFQAILCIPEPGSALTHHIAETMNIRIPYSLKTLASCDMSDLRVNPLMQPWLSEPDTQAFYNDFMIAFDAVFSRWQTLADPRVEQALKNPRVQRIFEPALSLPKPPDYLPYTLDRHLDTRPPYPQAKFRMRQDSPPARAAE